MLKLNIFEAKTHLSRHIRRLAAGETILLCRRNVPIAEIRPLRLPPSKARPIGLLKGRFKLGRGFFRTLPDSVMADFEGRGS
jgi:antitoxin (DNA-binding transcriptional repressor) of toxin-antitoxin stability system